MAASSYQTKLPEEIIACALYQIRTEGKTPHGDDIRYTPNKSEMLKLESYKISKKAVDWLIKQKSIIYNCNDQLRMLVRSTPRTEDDYLVMEAQDISRDILKSLQDEFVTVFPFLKYMDYRDISTFWSQIVHEICSYEDDRIHGNY